MNDLLRSGCVIGLVTFLLSLPPAASTVLAQTDTGKIEGYVRDRDTGSPLAGAQLLVDGTRLGNVTNDDGYYFILNVPVGQRNITAAFTGYQKTTVQNKLILAGQTARVNFEISSTVVSLEGITIESEAEPLIIRDNTVTKQRQTSAEIEALPVSDIDDIINMQAGVVKGEGGQISIRGGRVGEEAVYVDGVLMKNFGTEPTMPPLVGKTSLTELTTYVTDVKPDNSPLDVNTNAVEEITVITGGFNAEYGTAKSGVINIVTKEGSEQYTGNVRYRTDGVMPRSMDFGFNELSGSFGGPVPLLPFAYFNFSAESQGRADWSPKSTDSERGFRKVDQVFVDRINAALEGTTYPRATLDLIPGFGYPNPALRPGSDGNRYSVSEKVTYSPSKKLKFLQTFNISRTQRWNFRNSNMYQGAIYVNQAERGTVHNYLGGMDYNIRQTSGSSMNLQVRASYFLDNSAAGQFYNKTAFDNFVEQFQVGTPENPGKQYYIYKANLGELWDQPVNPALSDVTLGESIENFLWYDEKYATVDRGNIQGGLPVNYDLLPTPQEEFLGFSWKDWPMTSEYWNKAYPLTGDRWLVEIPGLDELRSAMTNDPEFMADYLIALPYSGSQFYKGPLGLRNSSFNDADYGRHYSHRGDKRYNLKMDFDTQVDRYNRVKLGVDWQFFDNFNYGTGETTYRATVIDNTPYLLSAYLQDRLDLGDFVLDFGLRFDMLDPQGQEIYDLNFLGESGSYRILSDRMWKKQYELAPRLGVAFPVTDRTQVRFSFGKFYQPPSFRQIFRGDNTNHTDAKLDYSETTMLEAGFTALFTDDLVFELVGYNKDIVGDFTYRQVFPVGVTESTVPAMTNMDNGNVKGFDLNIQHKWSRYFNSRFTYSLQFARSTGDDPIPSLGEESLKYSDPVTLDLYQLPVLVSPTDLDRTHTFNAQVYLMLPQDLRPGTMVGRIFRNVSSSFMFTLNSGSPFDLRNQPYELNSADNRLQWDLVNRGRSGTFMNGDLRLSKKFPLSGRRSLSFFVDVYNVFNNWVYNKNTLSPSAARGVFLEAESWLATEAKFRDVLVDRYEVDPSRGSYYWDNLHDLDKDGWVTLDEMRLLLLADNLAGRGNPSGTARQVRAGAEIRF
ncbi:MAG: carboxypeptidase-like regulatory domain-containing protein [Candidatus Glassbacteria bacterium]|nr:carboxypeptidase-like regulatory domain-containing protein [Candidatus Glassbacteria bacterium]